MSLCPPPTSEWSPANQSCSLSRELSATVQIVGLKALEPGPEGFLRQLGGGQRVLDDVEPDLSPSRYPEKVYFWKRLSQSIDAMRKVAMYRRLRRSA